MPEDRALGYVLGYTCGNVVSDRVTQPAEMDNVHRAVVQFALGHSSITLTIDTYSYVMSGREEVVARSIDDVLGDTVTVNNR